MNFYVPDLDKVNKTNSGVVYSIPTVVSKTIIKNGLERKLTDYMADVIFTYRLNIITSLNINKVVGFAAATLVGYFITKKLFKSFDSKYRQSVAGIPPAKVSSSSVQYKSGSAITEAQSIRVGGVEVLLEPIITPSLMEAQRITPGFFKRIFQNVVPGVKIIYEKRPTIIFEKEETIDYERNLKNCNYLELDAISGNIKIQVINTRTPVVLSTNIDNLPAKYTTSAELQDLMIRLKDLQRGK